MDVRERYKGQMLNNVIVGALKLLDGFNARVQRHTRPHPGAC
jgi:hypothetical protein